MKKPVKIALISALGLGVFSAGFFGKGIASNAASDWQANAQNQAQSELVQTAQNTTTQLTNNVNTDINNEINSQIATEVKKQQDDLNQLLQQYYNLKLQGLTDTQEYKDLVAKVDYYKQWAFDNYKQQIDQAFSNAGQ